MTRWLFGTQHGVDEPQQPAFLPEMPEGRLEEIEAMSEKIANDPDRYTVDDEGIQGDMITECVAEIRRQRWVIGELKRKKAK